MLMSPGFRVHFPPGGDAAAIRKRTGLSQAAFARQIGVPVATLRNWEQGRHAGCCLVIPDSSRDFVPHPDRMANAMLTLGRQNRSSKLGRKQKAEE
jgi:hypothetical protein